MRHDLIQIVLLLELKIIDIEASIKPGADEQICNGLTQRYCIITFFVKSHSASGNTYNSSKLSKGKQFQVVYTCTKRRQCLNLHSIVLLLKGCAGVMSWPS